MAPKAKKQSARRRVPYSRSRSRKGDRAFFLHQQPGGYVVERSSFRDVVGEQYSAENPAEFRRSKGITLTPLDLVERMVDLSAARGVEIARVVDAGAGTGRFTIAAARAFPAARVIAVENDRELARLLLSNLTAAGLGARVQVQVTDFRELSLPRIEGATLFIGNPPYVRHHDISARWKQWYSDALTRKGITASQLAGLHAHFLVKSMELAREGDLLCYVTAAEWLDTGYGRALRQLLLSYGRDIDIALMDRTSPIFSDALTTSVIITTRVMKGSSTVRLRHVGVVNDLLTTSPGTLLKSHELSSDDGWSKLASGVAKELFERPLRLGDLFAVHRGQVTGNNSVWIHGSYPGSLPDTVLYPAVTRARELISLRSDRLVDDASLKRVIDLPDDWSDAPRTDRDKMERFLSWARRNGAQESYIARHRNPWFKVRLREPAPIIMTYMGRRPPKFVRNVCGARLINIAHGLYPREPLPVRDLDLVTAWLNANVSRTEGRMYAGGLTKFEPREVERLRLPSLAELPSV